MCFNSARSESSNLCSGPPHRPRLRQWRCSIPRQRPPAAPAPAATATPPAKTDVEGPLGSQRRPGARNGGPGGQDGLSSGGVPDVDTRSTTADRAAACAAKARDGWDINATLREQRWRNKVLEELVPLRSAAAIITIVETVNADVSAPSD